MKISGYHILEFRDNFLSQIEDMREELTESQFDTLDRDTIRTEITELRESAIERGLDYLTTEMIAELPMGFKGWYAQYLYERDRIAELRDLQPDLKVLDRNYYLGMNAFENGDYEDAIVHFEQYLSAADDCYYERTPASHGSSPHAAYKRLLLSQGKQLQLVSIFKSLIKYDQYPESYALLVSDGFKSLKQGVIERLS